jgi:hypothetical protein
MERKLWICPRCRNRFVTPNMWHSCVHVPLDAHFASKDPRLRELYDAFLAFIRRHGPVRVVVQKTRICFQVRVRFAGVVVRKGWLECRFWLKRRLASPRFSRVEQYSPRDWGYYFHLTDPAQLDEEAAEWIKEAYAVGSQRSFSAAAR